MYSSTQVSLVLINTSTHQTHTHTHTHTYTDINFETKNCQKTLKMAIQSIVN